MSTPTSALPEPALEKPVEAPAALSPTRPLYWSIRRELWENRSIYVGPLIAAAVFLFGFSISMFTLPRRMRAVAALDPVAQYVAIAAPYGVAAALIILSAYLVGVFYCLDALYGERRDRTSLFWKSLPVSDLMTVLAKASIPLVVLPVLAFSIVMVTHAVMLFMNTGVLVVSGRGAAMLWARLPVFQIPLVLLYGLIVNALWHAPLFAWLLLVSSWARRSPFLWAVLPPLALGVFEGIAFQTSHFGSQIGYRVIGGMVEGFVHEKGHTGPLLSQLDPLGFLGSPGLWLGMAVAALFLAQAARLRRRGESI